MGNQSGSDAFVSRVTANMNLPVDTRPPVILAVILPPASAGSIAVVTSTAIEQFSLLTGARLLNYYNPPKAVQIVAAVHSPECSIGNIFIVADSTGVLRFIHSVVLCEVGQLNAYFEVTHLILAAPDLVYSAHLTGDIQVWHTSSNILQHAWEGSGTPIKALAYSGNLKLIAIVFQGSSSVYLHNTNAGERNKTARVLEGGLTDCCSIVMFERKKLMAGLGENQVMIWNLKTLERVLQFGIPQLEPELEVGWRLGVIDLKGESDVLVIGMTGGFAMISQLTADSSQQKVIWKPLKVLKAFGDRSSGRGCTYIGHDSRLDLLLVGLEDSTVTVVVDFLKKNIYSQEI